MGGAFGDEELEALDPADGFGDLVDESVAGVVGGGDELGGVVGGDGDGGIAEGEVGEVGGELEARGHHEGAVEGRGDGEHDGALGAGFFAELDGTLDCSSGSGDDGLLG